MSSGGRGIASAIPVSTSVVTGSVVDGCEQSEE